MLFYNITMMVMLMNLTTINETDLNTTGLYSIEYRDYEHRTYDGLFIPKGRKHGKIILYRGGLSKHIIKHELKHLHCWRKEGHKGWLDNIKHRGCFNS